MEDVNLENLDDESLIELMTILQGIDKELQEEIEVENNE